MASALSKNNLRFQTSYRPENTPKLTQKRGAPPPLVQIKPHSANDVVFVPPTMM